MNKIILAYSGGLDTSVILKWLLDKGSEVICFVADVGQQEDTLSRDYPEGYKEISNYFLNKLQDKRYDMLTKLVTIYAEEHTNYRLYPYSQHLKTKWYHPFSTALWASCYAQNTIVAKPKKHLFYIVSLRKRFPQTPWSIPKVGMSIPTKEKHVRTTT